MPLVGAVKRKSRALPTKAERASFYHADVNVEARRGFFYIVKPPAMVRVSYGDTPYRIQLPWQLFAVCLGFKAAIGYFGCGMWFMKNKPASRAESVYRAPLQNMNSSGLVCYGRWRPYSGLPLVKYVEQLYSSFWLSPFTDDISVADSSIPKTWRDEVEHSIFNSWMGEGNDVSSVSWRKASYGNVAGVIRGFPKDVTNANWLRQVF